jgi:WD40 repeat protein
VWDTRTGRHILDLKAHTKGVQSMAFSPDGTRFASASADGTVKVWDARIGQQPLGLKGHTNPVFSVAFSADGQTLASSGGSGEFAQSGEVKLWDVRSDQHRLDLQGHTSSVYGVAFTADGARIASGAGWFREPGEIKVWDAHTGQQLLHVKGHTNGVSGLAFSPDGRSLFSRDYRGDLRAWDSKTGQPIPEELVAVTAMLPYKITKGYGDPSGQVVKEVNGKRIRNLRHFVETLGQLNDAFVEFEFHEKYVETLVFERTEVLASMEDILTDNNIGHPCSADLRSAWKPVR